MTSTAAVNSNGSDRQGEFDPDDRLENKMNSDNDSDSDSESESDADDELNKEIKIIINDIMNNESENDNYRYVVSIDFGTDGTALAFADIVNNVIKPRKQWNEKGVRDTKLKIGEKLKTNILIKRRKLDKHEIAVLNNNQKKIKQLIKYVFYV